MFGFDDMGKFFLSLFFVFPLVTIIHQVGHLFFAKLFGCNVDIHIGTGNLLCRIGPFYIRKVYFFDGWCKYKALHQKRNGRVKWVLVYLGGSIFNILTIILVNSLILQNILNPNIFLYQFVYFSVYFVFFSLFPADLTSGCPNDGKAVLNIIFNKSFEKDPIN
ncbi:membrane protein [Bacillus sp. SA1-12]|uniref:membrane protein n=1 Tax=Bacillus sp. SA1-12 TaxID=1455638 RepID=UPI000625060B|nr:membrane protein [Bacillus sp. SA1-12]KKI92869.1 membrane protein [Bacillus sp. SA1-12]